MLEISVMDENRWCISGRIVPKGEVVFISQVIIVYIVVIVSIINLSLEVNDKNIWIILLSSCLGYLLPNPTPKHEQRFLHQPTEQHPQSLRG